jgi:hypothetical protein
MLMLGNLLRESGVVERLNQAAQNEIINIATLFLGLTIGSTMGAGSFLRLDTLGILVLGLLAFVLDTVAGLLFGKLLSALSGGTINPLIGAAGISAFPMAGRLAAKMAQDEDFENFILMHAMGANTAGQLGSVVAGGVLLALVAGLGWGEMPMLTPHPLTYRYLNSAPSRRSPRGTRSMIPISARRAGRWSARRGRPRRARSPRSAWLRVVPRRAELEHGGDAADDRAVGLAQHAGA